MKPKKRARKTQTALAVDAIKSEDGEFYRQLNVQSGQAKNALSNLMWHAERGGHFKHRIAALAHLINTLVETMARLESFERSEMAKFPQRGWELEKRTLSIIHVIAGQREFWPGLFSTNVNHAKERQKFIAQELELASFFHRNPSRNPRASTEWRVAKELHDEIHDFRMRRFDIPGKPHWLEAWNLRPPVDDSWWRVAEKFLEEHYGDQIGYHPRFAHWLQGRTYTDKDGDTREHSLGQAGVLSTRIRQRIKAAFMKQAPAVLVSRLTG